MLLVIISLLMLMCIDGGEARIQAHELDIQWMNEYLHRTAILTLLKTKANVLKRGLPNTESIVYAECSSTARSPSLLAKCVVKLLNARDELKFRNEEEFGKHPEPKSQDDLYEKMQELVNEVLGRNNQVEMFEQIEVRSHIEEVPIRVLSRPKKSVAQRSPLQNLQRIQRYMKMLDKYNKQLVKLNDENAKFINEASMPTIQFKVQPKQTIPMMDKVVELVNNLKNSNVDGTLKILSPKLFPIMPSRKNRNRLLSPTLFSFQQDGYFSLPQLFQLASIGRNETDSWLETLLTLSGADKELDKVIRLVEPQMQELEQQTYPRLIELDRWQRQLKRAKQTYSIEQKEQLKNDGYTFLTPNQMSLIYSSPLAPKLSEEAKLFARMSIEQRERRIEDDIRNLAKLNSLIPSNLQSTQHIKERRKRASNIQQTNSTIVDYVEISQNVEVNYGPEAKVIQRDDDTIKLSPTVNSSFDLTQDNCGDNDPSCSPLMPPTSTQAKKEEREETEEKEEKEELPKFETLKPFAFGSRINEAVVLEGLTLSPYAFFAQLAQPEMLNFEILSPRAFISSVLSPSALIARVLSPAAFRAEILSPRTLVAWVLVPEALILEVLSPKAIETRIASPEALIIQILSPNTLAPKVLSPEALGVVVLSPSFLSPRFKSGEKLMVQILSPNILGGGSSEEGSHGHNSHEHNSHEHNEKECCEDEGSGHHESNVQPTWQLKKENQIHDSQSHLFLMRDWET